jgi:glutamine amidotransferase
MCRWVAYGGQSIYLDTLLFGQKNSLISQSIQATRSAHQVNGDGFGVAWYGNKGNPGVFKDILPAWNDENLRELSQHIESSLFLAHVRASTGTGVSRVNCHPFSYQNWTFMHNGHIGGWHLHRREIESHISKEYYSLRHGSTDSEAMFLLALSFGLQQDPVGAITKAIEIALFVMGKSAEQDPLRFSAALSNGESIWAFRFSSDGQSPSLFYGAPELNKVKHAGKNFISTIASEPFDDQLDHWVGIEESSYLHWHNGKVEVRRLVI